MKRTLLLSLVVFLTIQAFATKLVEVNVLDKDYIHLYFVDGEATFVDDAKGNCPYDHCEDLDHNDYIPFGSPLNTSNAQNNGTYSITSSDDGNYTSAKQPLNVYRKTKISDMVQRGWINDDYTYDFGYEHHLFLKLPMSMQQGKTYSLTINGNTNSDQTNVSFAYDIFTVRSEAIKVNVVGYTKSTAIKAADVYYWMGDGAARDYSSFEGNKIYLFDVNSKTSVEVGTLIFGTNEATEMIHGHKLLKSKVWHADFTGNYASGKYTLAIEGIGCSDTFEISDEAYREPFGISVKGFFYMRIGQDNLNMIPVPRRPLYIPNSSPSNCKVYLTSMSPYHPQWGSFTSGDAWDQEQDWVQFKLPGNPTNPNAYGGHSDALDWDRHLGHVSIIYDMLLPYILTDGAQSDDDLGIAESGNGIPDLLDEAKNEVDFWLRLRDQNGGYSHGLTNPDGDNALYQAAATGVAAWANAANAAMLAHAYQIAGEQSLKQVYTDSAVAAYAFANALADPQLNKTQNVGYNTMSGVDFKLLAAVFLYNVTGNTDYEIVVNDLSGITSGTSTVTLSNIHALAGYLFTPQVVHYQSLYENMKAAVIYHAKDKEANYSLTRPSRRASDNSIGWMQTEIGVQRTMVAHAITNNQTDKQFFENALTLEADYSLGRNPMSRILMTTATTALQHERSIENAYTSGFDDGTPGVHPGHTPYLNLFSWGGNRYMGNPEKMAALSYPIPLPGAANPAGLQWPMGEIYYNTRYVYAHSEFTPQQTMRGKTALYAYLYGLGPNCKRPNLGADVSICGLSEVTLNANLPSTGRSFTWEGPNGEIDGASTNSLIVMEAGTYTVTSNESGCIKSDRIVVKGELDPVFLGDDVNLCTTTSIMLDASITGNGYLYEWQKDGQVIADAEERTLIVKKEGTYTATVMVAGCSNQSDEIIVTSSLLNVLEDTTCGTGSVTLKILGSGDYTWHTDSDTEDILKTGAIYEPTISESTTYYVEATGIVTDYVGLKQPGSSTWGSWDGSFNDKTEFTTTTPIKITSVKVQVNNPGNVTINLYSKNSTTIVASKTQAVTNGLEEIILGFNVPVGDYALNLTGTTAGLVMDNENGDYVAYPYSIDNIISITGVDPAWASTRYMFIYDWKIEFEGSSCVRTPIQAVYLDPSNPLCKITGSSEIDSKKLSLYPNPTSSHISLSSELEYQVYNTMGELLLKGKDSKISLLELPSGMYLIRTVEGVQQVIKE